MNLKWNKEQENVKNYTMNRRNQEIVSDEALVAHLKKNYTYDATRGVVVNRKLNRVVKGCMNDLGYMATRLRIGGKLPSIKLHHMVWVVVHGCFPKVIDHINGDKSDNRLENLREVTPSENRMNSVHPWRPNVKTGLPGIEKNGLKYRTKIMGKRFSFHDKYEAFIMAALCGKMYQVRNER